MGQVFGSGGNITHVEGSRIVWSNTRRPALLLPEAAETLSSFDIAFPDFSKSDAYGYVIDSFGSTSSCISFASIDPQEWDSGLSFVCNLPSMSNYFELELSISRIVTPSTWLSTGQPIPALLGEGYGMMPDGNAAIIEGIGPLVRMFAFERVGNAVYLRRKQSVSDGGQRVPWNSGNNNSTGNGGQRNGFTYGGNPNAWPAYMIQSKSGGSFAKRRGEGNACSLADPTNYSSLWRGTVTITPGYIAP